jgi:hypothetical protein
MHYAVTSYSPVLLCEAASVKSFAALAKAGKSARITLITRVTILLGLISLSA